MILPDCAVRMLRRLSKWHLPAYRDALSAGRASALAHIAVDAQGTWFAWPMMHMVHEPLGP